MTDAAHPSRLLKEGDGPFAAVWPDSVGGWSWEANVDRISIPRCQGGADGELRMPRQPHDVDTLPAFAEWLAAIPREQRFGESAVSGNDWSTAADGATKFVELCVFRRFSERDDEYRHARQSAINTLAMDVHRLIGGSPGAVCWRITPEFSVHRTSVMMRLGDDGPDKDYSTDRRGWADNGYGYVAAYARLAVLGPQKQQQQETRSNV